MPKPLPNALEWYIKEQRLDPVAVMNRLQGEGGPVSDLAVLPCDIGEEDARKAVDWLRLQGLPGASLVRLANSALINRN